MHATMKKLYKKNYVFKPNVCPEEISLPMLIEEMKSPDTILETYKRDQLWECYYNIMFPPNKFGLTADLTDNTPLFYFKEADAPLFNATEHLNSKSSKNTYGLNTKSSKNTYGLNSKSSKNTYGTEHLNTKSSKNTYGLNTKSSKNTYGLNTKSSKNTYGTKKLNTKSSNNKTGTKKLNTKSSKNKTGIAYLNKIQSIKTKGGTLLPANTQLIDPQWRYRNYNGGQYWSTVIHIDGTDIFGSSIPFPNELTCFQTFAFYMYRLEIKRIISLHSCALHPDRYCNQNFINMENVLWDALSLLDQSTPRDAVYHPNYGFEDAPIHDMASGPINSWLTLNRVPFNDANNRTLIHCAGGYGRTCSALLMLSWKRKYQRYPGPGPDIPTANNWPAYEDPARLSRRYIGFANSRALYEGLWMHFSGRIHVFTDAVNIPFQDRINLMGNQYPAGNPLPPPNINVMRDEVFQISTDYLANVFIERVNRMIMCWASNHLTALRQGLPGSPPMICLFPCHTTLLGTYTPDNIFQPGILNYMLSANAHAAQAEAMALQQFYGPPIVNTRQNI